MSHMENMTKMHWWCTNYYPGVRLLFSSFGVLSWESKEAGPLIPVAYTFFMRKSLQENEAQMVKHLKEKF